MSQKIEDAHITLNGQDLDAGDVKIEYAIDLIAHLDEAKNLLKQSFPDSNFIIIESNAERIMAVDTCKHRAEYIGALEATKEILLKSLIR